MISNIKTRISALWTRFESQLFAFTDTRGDERVSDNIRIAMNLGTTLPTRLWISLSSMILGAQLLQGTGSAFSAVGYEMFFRWVPSEAWASALIFSGALMLWRVLTPNGAPLWGWVSNGLALAVWTAIIGSRLLLLGLPGIVSLSTVIYLQVAWVTLRTEATRRDRETA